MGVRVPLGVHDMNKFSGIVQKGAGYGHWLGFPTVNIPLPDESVSGIFAAKVHVEGKEYKAASYADVKNKTLEAHLLDFDGDVYGKSIEIELLEKIREDVQFTSESDAKEKIAADIAAIRTYFNR